MKIETATTGFFGIGILTILFNIVGIFLIPMQKLTSSSDFVNINDMLNFVQFDKKMTIFLINIFVGICSILFSVALKRRKALAVKLFETFGVSLFLVFVIMFVVVGILFQTSGLAPK